jgi:hypothetical protein
VIHGARVTRRGGFDVATLPQIIAFDTRDNRAAIAPCRDVLYAKEKP